MHNQEIIPAETLTPSCRDANELAERIGALVSAATGAVVKIKSMRLGIETPDGDISINWKRGK